MTSHFHHCICVCSTKGQRSCGILVFTMCNECVGLESVEIDNEVYAIMLNDGPTALLHAVMGKNGPVVGLLRGMGADVCIQNKLCVSKYWCVI